MSVLIKDLDKVEVLRALWNNSEPAVFFKISGKQSPPFDETEAKKAVNQYIDYFCGRVIKMDLSKNVISAVSTYESDTGKKVAAIIDNLRNR